MFVLVTFQPDTPETHQKVAAIAANRKGYRLQGSAYIVKPTGKEDARRLQAKLEAYHAADNGFDYNWFRINPHHMKYFPDKPEQRPEYDDFNTYQDILKEDN